MTRQDVLEMIRDSNNIAERKYVLVDLRRADHGSLETFTLAALRLAESAVWLTNVHATDFVVHEI